MDGKYQSNLLAPKLPSSGRRAISPPSLASNATSSPQANPVDLPSSKMRYGSIGQYPAYPSVPLPASYPSGPPAATMPSQQTSMPAPVAPVPSTPTQPQPTYTSNVRGPQIMKWTKENERLLLLAGFDRKIVPGEHQTLTGMFPEGPSKKAVQEKLSKLRNERRLLLQSLGYTDTSASRATAASCVAPVPLDQDGSPLSTLQGEEDMAENATQSLSGPPRKRRKTSTLQVAPPSLEPEVPESRLGVLAAAAAAVSQRADGDKGQQGQGREVGGTGQDGEVVGDV